MHCLQMVCRDSPDISLPLVASGSALAGYLWDKESCFLSISLGVHTKRSVQTAVSAWIKFLKASEELVHIFSTFLYLSLATNYFMVEKRDIERCIGREIIILKNQVEKKISFHICDSSNRNLTVW